MYAFDAMPAEFRAFCANYGRTARGESLAALLGECSGDVAWASRKLAYLLPLEEPPPLRRGKKPIATYDLKAERRLAKPPRKRKAK